jgi:DNA helicase IV
MADIVETIQAEQDHVIRAPHGGVLVVQGGAGTGKTAVALHRAAYLLYTYRQQLEKRGVLVVGPNSTFLRYIGEVLPALGETAVVLAPVSGLFPGVTGDRPEPEEAAEIKGRPVMAEVVAAAVRDRQHVPDGALVVFVDGERVRLPAAAIRRARTAARRTRRPHNEARPVFVEQFVAEVAAEYAADLGERSGAGRSLAGVAGELDLDLLTAQLGDHESVLDALDELWPSLTPQRFLAELLMSTGRLRSAGPPRTCRCWTRPPSCWASTTGPPGRWARPAAGRRSSRRRTSWTSSPAPRPRRPTTSATWRTPTDCPQWT